MGQGVSDEFDVACVFVLLVNNYDWLSILFYAYVHVIRTS